MSGIANYLAMGGYAFYVWSAYGAAAAVLGGLTLWSWRSYRAAARALERLQSDRAAPR
jgi:heme exporter protein D